MKRLICAMSLAAALAAPTASFAGFFGPDVPEGGTALTPAGDDSMVFVKDGFVFDAGYKHFFYDSKTHLAVFSPAYDTDNRRSKQKLKQAKRSGNTTARTALIKDEQLRSILDSMAADPKAWEAYFKNQSCEDDTKLRAGLKMKKGEKANLIAKNCSALQQQVAAALAGIDGAEQQDISSGGERWKAVAALGLVPEVSIPFKYEQATDALKKASDPATTAKIERIMKDMPPEDEIITVIEAKSVKTVTTTTPRHKTIGGNVTGGKTTSHEETVVERSPSILTNEVFENKQLQAILGNVAFTDDVFVAHLKDFDYGLTNPDWNPEYATQSVEVAIPGNGAMLHQGVVPRAAYAWMRGFTHSAGLFLPEANTVAGPGDEGRFIAFPFIADTLTLEQYKTGWTTWHAMVQGMSNDEIRKLVLFSDVVRGADLNSPIHSTVNARGVANDQAATSPAKAKKANTADAARSMFGAPKAPAGEESGIEGAAATEDEGNAAPTRRKKARRTAAGEGSRANSIAAQRARHDEQRTYAGVMAFAVTHSVAPQWLPAVNLPTYWDCANLVFNHSNGANPGLTAGEWYGLTLSAGGPAVNENPAFQEFTKSLFAGDAAAAKAVVTKNVSDAALANTVKAAKAALKNPELDDQVKPKVAQAIAVNPMGIYKHLGEVLTGIFNPGGN